MTPVPVHLQAPAPPQNEGYMSAAYVVAGLIYAGYVLMLWGKSRRLMK